MGLACPQSETEALQPLAHQPLAKVLAQLMPAVQVPWTAQRWVDCSCSCLLLAELGEVQTASGTGKLTLKKEVQVLLHRIHLEVEVRNFPNMKQTVKATKLVVERSSRSATMELRSAC